MSASWPLKKKFFFIKGIDCSGAPATCRFSNKSPPKIPEPLMWIWYFFIFRSFQIYEVTICLLKRCVQYPTHSEFTQTAAAGVKRHFGHVPEMRETPAHWGGLPKNSGGCEALWRPWRPGGATAMQAGREEREEGQLGKWSALILRIIQTTQTCIHQREVAAMQSAPRR